MEDLHKSAMGTTKGKTFQEEGTSCAQVLRKEDTWCTQIAHRKLLCMESREGAVTQDEAGEAGTRSCRDSRQFGLYSKRMGNWKDFICLFGYKQYIICAYKVYNFIIYSRSCATITMITLRTFLSPQKVAPSTPAPSIY